MVDSDFYTKLTTLQANDTAQNRLPQDDGSTSVWFQKLPSYTERFLSGEVLYNETNFAVEVRSLDIDTMGSLTETLRTGLDHFQGTMGSTYVYLSTVADVSDDYIFKTMDEDKGFHVSAFTVKIMH